MAQKSITKFLRHRDVYRVGLLNYKKKSDSIMVLWSKMANFGDNTMVQTDFFDDSTMVLLELKKKHASTVEDRYSERRFSAFHHYSATLIPLEKKTHIYLKY